MGESGSGKSLTSLSILRLLDDAARVEGAIRFEGQDLLTLKPEQMRHYRGRKIAMIFQEPMTALNPVMPVGRQIAEAIETHQPELGRKQVRDAVVEAMTAVAIAEPEQPPARLSSPVFRRPAATPADRHGAGEPSVPADRR